MTRIKFLIKAENDTALTNPNVLFESSRRSSRSFNCIGGGQVDRESITNVAVFRWIDLKNEWHVETLNGDRLFEIPHCGNFGKFVPKPDKERKKLYLVKITEIT